jgi:hypothetical protein
MTYAAVPRFEIGRVLSRMSGVVARNFLVFAGLALILSGLPHFLATLVERDLLQQPFGPFGPGWIIALLTNTLLQGALIHGTVSDLNGRPASLGATLGTAVRNLLPLIGIAIATTVATLVGLVLFVVPGVILTLALCVSGRCKWSRGTGSSRPSRAAPISPAIIAGRSCCSPCCSASATAWCGVRSNSSPSP